MEPASRPIGDLEEELTILDGLVDCGHLPPDQRDALVARLAAAPTREAWVSFAWVAGLAIGAGLVLAGVMYLVAFNWDQLGIVARLSMVFAALLGCATGAVVLGPRSAPGQLCAIGAAVLAGSALVVYSQVYQTGADPWELLAWWSVLAAPFVLAARTPAAWALLVLLLDTTLCTALGRDEVTVTLALTAAGVGHLVLGEAFRGSWLQQVLRLAGGLILTIYAGIFAGLTDRTPEMAVAFSVVVIGGIAVQAAFLARRVAPSTATLAWFALAVTVFAGIGGALHDHGAAEVAWLLVMGAVVTALTVGGFVWLIGLPRLLAPQEQP